MLLAALLLGMSLQDRAAAVPPGATLAAPERTADGSQRWSVLADPCASAQTGGNQIVVCGTGEQAPRLPLPDERGPPDRPMPSNPNLTGIGALEAVPTPCAARVGGCQVGVDLFGAATTLVRGVGKIISPDSCCEEPGESTNIFKLVGDAGKGVGRAFKKKPDKSNRVPIDLSDPVPPTRPSPAAPSIPPVAPASPTGATGAPSQDP
ncbi:hypothetical protein [Sphingomonas sp. TDK1]|uniref:hypothetical protein n=1 Tax=Sphingomonas sp. TDK1 TaxID=453247 RepID=UPI0007D9B2D3|nr:hypothetical protein [Sphingomonas sp. TDK1]OAN63844.1 hypothetical protein A7X12_18695 [Sphingomonas sp. TDK1]